MTKKENKNSKLCFSIYRLENLETWRKEDISHYIIILPTSLSSTIKSFLIKVHIREARLILWNVFLHSYVHVVMKICRRKEGMCMCVCLNVKTPHETNFHWLNIYWERNSYHFQLFGDPYALSTIYYHFETPRFKLTFRKCFCSLYFLFKTLWFSDNCNLMFINKEGVLFYMVYFCVFHIWVLLALYDGWIILHDPGQNWSLYFMKIELLKPIWSFLHH